MIMSRYYVTVRHVYCYGLYLSRDINLQRELIVPHPFFSCIDIMWMILIVFIFLSIHDQADTREW